MLSLAITVQLMKLSVGNIYWLTTEGKIAHPHVIFEIEENGNQVKVCSITTNQKKIHMPGNVVLEIGEGNLEKESIIEVAKVSTVKISELTNYIGHLSGKRVQEIIAGINFLQKTYFNK